MPFRPIQTTSRVQPATAGGFRPIDVTPSQRLKTEEPKEEGILSRVAKGIGAFTGVTGVARGVGEAARVARGLATRREVAPRVSPAQFAGSAAKLGLTAATIGTGGVAAGIRGAAGLGARTVESGVIGGVFQALGNIERKEAIGKGVGRAALIGGAIPGVGTAAVAAKRAFGRGAQRGGEKILTTIIKPSKADLADGFKIATVTKNRLGGTLKQMAQKTEDRISSLAKQLSTKIKGSDTPVDINQIARKTVDKLLKDKTRQFGEVRGVRRAIEGLQAEILEVTPSGIVDLAEAQAIKQAAGRKGAWVFGNADPDARAVEKVYTAFYRNLRRAIEKAAPPGVQNLNNRLSNLIPVQHAIIRRIPVAERNNAISLPDVIAGGFGFINPAGFAILGARRLAASGRFGAFLTRAGERLAKQKPPRTVFGRRILGD